ncbi:hypothetical protein D3C72_1461060 [compost metagenome]
MAQAAQIGAGAGQAVDMVDAQAIQHAFAIQAQHQAMHGIEDRAVFHAHTNQFADLEEAAPVDLLGRGAPPRQPVVLAFQQIMQPRPARVGGGVAGGAQASEVFARWNAR